MSAKYVTFANGQPDENELPSTSRTTATTYYKKPEVHIYRNYPSNDDTNDDDCGRIKGNKCVTDTTGASQAAQSLAENNEPYEDDNFNTGYSTFFLRNRRQFLSISGGLVLLFPAGLHIVWALTEFAWLKEDENTVKVFVIFMSWYLGAIIGSLLGGILVPLWSKRPLYFLGAILTLISAILLWYDVDFLLISGRLLAGVSHGILYITVIVHASENSVKEFREILILLIGAALNCSYILAALIFQPIDRVFLSKSFLSIGSIVYIILGIPLVLRYSIESVPFLIREYCTEAEALQQLAELQQKEVNHRTVYQDYLTIRKMCDDELMIYGSSSYSKLFAKCNFRPLIFCCYGRIISVLSINLPVVAMILIFLRKCIEELMPESETIAIEEIVASNITFVDNTTISSTISKNVLVGLYNHEIQLVITAWCAFGLSTVAVVYLFDRKRLVYYSCCGLGTLLIFCGVAHAFYNFLTTVMHLCLIGYFNYTTFAMDLFGHGFLAEAFPSTLKPISIAYVMAVEHFIHIVLISLYMAPWFHNRIIVTMVLVAILAFEIGRNLPRTNDLSLTEAEREYRKINIRFVDTVVDNYALRMV